MPFLGPQKAQKICSTDDYAKNCTFSPRYTTVTVPRASRFSLNLLFWVVLYSTIFKSGSFRWAPFWTNYSRQLCSYSWHTGAEIYNRWVHERKFIACTVYLYNNMSQILVWSQLIKCTNHLCSNSSLCSAQVRGK